MDWHSSDLSEPLWRNKHKLFVTSLWKSLLSWSSLITNILFLYNKSLFPYIYYKLDTFGFPSCLPPCMPSALLMPSFKGSFTPTCRSITDTAPPQRKVSEKLIWEDQVFSLIAIMKKTCGHSLIHHYSLSTKTRMDDLHGHTLVSYYKEQLWSVNCPIVSVGGNRDTKDEVNIRLPNV